MATKKRAKELAAKKKKRAVGNSAGLKEEIADTILQMEAGLAQAAGNPEFAFIHKRHQGWLKFYKLLLKHGRSFKPAPKPKGISWGQVKACFFNAFFTACGKLGEDTGLTYCEGVAFGGGIAATVGMVHHAWAIDHAGNVIDNTWHEVGVAYFGIPFDMKFAAGLVANCDTFGGLFIAKPQLLDGIPPNALAKL